jgi:hypothetical protein
MISNTLKLEVLFLLSQSSDNLYLTRLFYYPLFFLSFFFLSASSNGHGMDLAFAVMPRYTKQME